MENKTRQRAIKVLVIVTDYPGKNRKEAHRFVHVRNLYYQENGIQVTVLSFSAEKDYTYEGINVISYKTFLSEKEKHYDALVSHQPNLRQHLRFICIHGKAFPKYILFFHGHEVLRMSTAYPPPYEYIRNSKLKKTLRDWYDIFKLSVWRRFIPNIIDKSTLVFVSNWMLDEFLKATRLNIQVLKDHYYITYNCIGKVFEDNSYDFSSVKKYDFITIRSNLDGSKYCIDIVTELARSNPEAKFLVVGRGKFFDYNEKPENLDWKNTALNHQEIVRELNTARCALMPTRTDAQGLMMCEMATFGIPLITSNLPVCHEALDEFENVRMIPIDKTDIKIMPYCEDMERFLPYQKNEKYFNKNTSAHEVEIIHKITEVK